MENNNQAIPSQLWHPLDIGRLLLWVLWFPDRLKIHREMYGETAEKYLAGWLISTLVWLPLFLMTFAVGFELIPLADEIPYLVIPPIEARQLLGSGIFIIIIWVFTSIFGFNFARIWVFIAIGIEITVITYRSQATAMFLLILILLGAPLALAFFAISSASHFIKPENNNIIQFTLKIIAYLVIFIGSFCIAFIIIIQIVFDLGLDMTINVTNGSFGTYAIISIIINIVPTIIVTENLALKGINNSIETGKFSYFNRFLFILLIANYAFIIWTYYLNGWQYFK